MSPELSVILCTHNPRADYLARVLAALRAQTLPPAAWELLVVDNASSPPVAPAPLAWHPAGRLVREATPGLTAARRAGIAAATAPLLVFVDDDNLLAPDYLAHTRELARAWPGLGLWGCGHFEPEWEAPPAPELTPYLAYLAVGRQERDVWSNHVFDYAALPAGAGLSVRADVARRYAQLVTEDPRRLQLGRQGASLGACEDFDLGQTAIALGYGTGIFVRLRLTHLMPAVRGEEAYLQRLVIGHARSTVLLHALHGRAVAPPRGWLAWLRRHRYLRSLGPVERRIARARAQGEAEAFRQLAGPVN